MLTIQICNRQLLSDHDLVAPAFRNTLHDGQMAQSSSTLPQGGKEKKRPSSTRWQDGICGVRGGITPAWHF